MLDAMSTYSICSPDKQCGWSLMKSWSYDTWGWDKGSDGSSWHHGYFSMCWNDSHGGYPTVFTLMSEGITALPLAIYNLMAEENLSNDESVTFVLAKYRILWNEMSFIIIFGMYLNHKLSNNFTKAWRALLEEITHLASNSCFSYNDWFYHWIYYTGYYTTQTSKVETLGMITK